MARYSYGGGAADFVFDVGPTGNLRLRPAILQVWADQGGGVRVDDLVLNGEAVTAVPVGDTGQVPTFQGPDGYDADLWAATAPDKPRIRLTSNAGVQQIEAARALLDETVADVQAALTELGPLAEIDARIDGHIDHGEISGNVTLSGPTGSHWFEATGPTTITLDGYAEGQVCSLLCFSGADDVAVAGAADFKVADELVVSAMLARGTWVTGGGEPPTPDTTPPTPVTDLTATGGESTLTLAWSAATDDESTTKYGWKIWLNTDPEPADYTIRTAPGVTVTGLPAGTYNAKVYSYSSGGSTTPDTASAAVTAPAEPLVDAMLADDPAYLFMLDDAPGTAKPANLGSGTINTTDEGVFGGVAFGVTSIGGAGTCAEFDGTGYIRSGIPANDAEGKFEYTIEWLMEAPAPVGAERYVYEGGDYSRVIVRADGSVGAYAGNHVAGSASYGAPVMMAVVLVGGRNKVYRNGVEVSDTTGWNPITGPNKSPMIGAQAGGDGLGATPGTAAKFLGKMAAFAIYHTAVSPARLQAHAVSAGTV